MPFDSKAFLAELVKDVNLTDEQKTALQSTLENSVISKRLEEGQLRQSDYSRLAGEYQQKVQQATTYYNELVTWKAQEQQRLDAERAAPVVSSASGVASEPFISKAELNTELNKIQSGAIGFISTLNDKSLEYFQEFGKRLDTQAVLKKAQDDNTNFIIAYERFIQPERETKAKAELEVRIKREREEAVKEALANASIPTAQQPQIIGGQPHVLDIIANKQSQIGWKAAVAAHTADIAAGTVKHE